MNAKPAAEPWIDSKLTPPPKNGKSFLAIYFRDPEIDLAVIYWNDYCWEIDTSNLSTEDDRVLYTDRLPDQWAEINLPEMEEDK